MSKNISKGYRNIILVGMPCSGKSTLGKTYAHHTHRAFLDFDQFVERSMGKPIAKVFTEEGEGFFRSIENKCLKKIERRQNHVIALGGGTLCSSENLEMARTLGLVVFLDTPLDILANRLFLNPGARPLFADLCDLQDAKSRVTELWEQRQSWYVQADVILVTQFSSVDNLKLQLGAVEQRAFSKEYQRNLSAITGEYLQVSGPFKPSVRTERNERPVSREGGYRPKFKVQRKV